jgi:acyl-coenzyme A synthetase/AMP-(fatty) acid ligase
VGKPSNKYIILNQLSSKNKKEIKIIKPWPGCMKRILNGEKEWKKYWSSLGEFKLFDLGTKKNGNIYIHGRTDDVINIRGHRIGSEEIESVVLKIKEISECCAVAIEDQLEGQIIKLFVVSKNKVNNLIENQIISAFGSFALPKKIYYVKKLPKTRSGKILRRLIRAILLDPNKKYYGDTSTIIDINVIKEIKKVISKNE